jgi:hypothetical protein
LRPCQGPAGRFCRRRTLPDHGHPVGAENAQKLFEIATRLAADKLVAADNQPRTVVRKARPRWIHLRDRRADSV